jgi:hypothetical protein
LLLFKRHLHVHQATDVTAKVYADQCSVENYEIVFKKKSLNYFVDLELFDKQLSLQIKLFYEIKKWFGMKLLQECVSVFTRKNYYDRNKFYAQVSSHKVLLFISG